MGTIARTTPNYNIVEAAMQLTSDTMGTRRTLDLTNKDNAIIHVKMGRSVVTALTRSAYVFIRKTFNDGTTIPNGQYDIVSQTALAVKTTLNGAVSADATSCVVTSNTGLVIGDIVCVGLGGLRLEWFKIFQISGTTITPDRPFKFAHNSGDDFCTIGDVQSVDIPGGDKYEIRCCNQTGVAINFEVLAEVLNGDTISA